MSEIAEYSLRSLAITNLLMMMTLGFLLPRWPLYGSKSTFSPILTIGVLILFIADWIFTIRVINMFMALAPDLFQKRQRMIVISYYVTSFVTRILVTAEGTYFVYVFSGASFSALFPSLLFAYITNIIRKSPAALRLRGRLTILMILNILMGVLIIMPFVTSSLVIGINVVYFIVLIVAGFIKGISFIVGAVIYFTTTEKLRAQLPEESDALYPKEVDPNWNVATR